MRVVVGDFFVWGGGSGEKTHSCSTELWDADDSGQSREDSDMTEKCPKMHFQASSMHLSTIRHFNSPWSKLQI